MRVYYSIVYEERGGKGSAQQPLLQQIHINNSRKYQTHLMHLDASLSDYSALYEKDHFNQTQAEFKKEAKGQTKHATQKKRGEKR